MHDLLSALAGRDHRAGRLSAKSYAILSDALKGGRGSGNWGHSGLPGVWGGSRPRGGGGRHGGAPGRPRPERTVEEMAGDSATAKAPWKSKEELEAWLERFDANVAEAPAVQYNSEHLRLASNMITKHTAAEPKVTPFLEGVAGELGGTMVGLENRLKSSQSLARKIAMTEQEVGNASAAAGYMTDVLRYTMRFDSAEYTDKVNRAYQKMLESGYELYDHKARNYFGSPYYKGMNTVFVHKGTGVAFELQFHTPESLAFKDMSHLIYERERLTSDEADRRILQKAMRDLWEAMPLPAGWENLPGRKM